MPAATSSDAQGVLAALGVALCWAVTAIAFGAASRRIGQFHVNLTRLVLACVLLGAACTLLGSFKILPLGQVVLLAASGIVGLSFGDAALFIALQILGPRRASLLMALAPGLAALLAWPLLGESLSVVGVVGMLLTLAGVVWVILERGQPGEIQGRALLGGFMGVLGAVGQAVGLILSKGGLGVVPEQALLCRSVGITIQNSTSVHPLYGTLLRVLAALLVLAVYAWFNGSYRQTWRSLDDSHALRLVSIGTFFGPFLGISLSLAAVSWTSTYVAATIMAIQPIVVIPLVALLYRQRITGRAISGACLTVAGVAVLSLREQLAGWF